MTGHCCYVKHNQWEHRHVTTCTCLRHYCNNHVADNFSCVFVSVLQGQCLLKGFGLEDYSKAVHIPEPPSRAVVLESSLDSWVSRHFLYLLGFVINRTGRCWHAVFCFVSIFIQYYLHLLDKCNVVSHSMMFRSFKVSWWWSNGFAVTGIGSWTCLSLGHLSRKNMVLVPTL